MRTLMILCCVIVGSITVNAQDTVTNTNGVYLSKEDFLSNNVYHLAKNDDRNFVRISSNQSILLYRGPEKAKFKFREVYGYLDKGERYRNFGAIKFFTKYGFAKVVDDRGLVLYSAIYATYKVGRIHYFYSLTKDSPVKEFSKRNLRKDFAGNTEFLQAMMKLKFRDYSSQTNGRYLINDLYLKSRNKK
ncbi:MAG: hypothetical protein C0490_07865 [Marivirga sp.]|nr:hypothetical protein [Marivirga sp.]